MVNLSWRQFLGIRDPNKKYSLTSKWCLTYVLHQQKSLFLYTSMLFNMALKWSEILCHHLDKCHLKQIWWKTIDGSSGLSLSSQGQAVLSGFAVHWMSHDRMLGILGFYTIGWILSNTKFITLGISLSWIEWFYINVGTLCIHNQGDDKLCKLQVTASLCYMRKACLALHLYLLMGNLCFGSRLMNYSYSQ